MKILYRQNSTTEDNTAFSALNIKNLYLREIMYKTDYKITTLKCHRHTEYEIHMIFCGKQCYETDGVIYEINENEFIIIPPGMKHRIVFTSENLLKYSITFNSEEILSGLAYRGVMTEAVTSSIKFISDEFLRKLPSSSVLIGNRVFEVLILLLRIVGHKEQSINTETHFGDARLDLAKKFIRDNIEQNLSVAEVAAFCYISPRHLTRIFLDTEGVSPAKYINSEKMKKISEYIKNSDLSLRQISEIFSYNNEYYFNTAFKNYFGMPPLAYRKMFR